MSDHDLVIANDTRTNVRADINLALIALVNGHSGSSAPATTYPYMPWNDTGNGVRKQRNAANSGWILRGPLAETLVISRSSDTVLGVANYGCTIIATSTFTQTLTAAATLGDGWYCEYRNDGSGVITLDPNGSEQIDGATTITLAAGENCIIKCNGSAFKTIGRATITNDAYLPFTSSVGSNALTGTLAAGAVLNFTVAGVSTPVTTSGALTLTIPDTALVGTTSAVISKIWWGAIYNSGTPEFFFINCYDSTTGSISGLDVTNTISTTANGTGADSAGVFYSTTSRASQPFVVIGFTEQTEATAGVWATAPSKTQGYGAGVALPNTVVQTRYSADSAVANSATPIPGDNTIPQNTEGFQVMSLDITPLGASNILEVFHVGVYSALNNSGQAAGIAIFQDSVVNALASVQMSSTGPGSSISISYRKLARSVSSTTFNIRAGSSSAEQLYFNGRSSAAVYGGVAASTLKITEIVR